MRGALLCLVSAACFATLGVFGKLAGDAGANIPTLLLVRFGVAALAFWLLLRATGGWAALRRLPWRVVLTGLGLGAAGYSLQSTLFFAAIDRLDVSLVSLLLYTYPACVTMAALALGRAQPTLRVTAALVVASAGLALVLLAAGTGAFDLVGALFALAASLTYTTYILISDRIIGAVDPFALSTLVLTGATSSFALVSTFVAVAAFFAGLRRVGPSEAAIRSTFEPVVTVVLAFLVLGAVIVLQLPARRRAARSRRTALRAAPAASAPSGLDVSSA